MKPAAWLGHPGHFTWIVTASELRHPNNSDEVSVAMRVNCGDLTISTAPRIIARETALEVGAYLGALADGLIFPEADSEPWLVADLLIGLRVTEDDEGKPFLCLHLASNRHCEHPRCWLQYWLPLVPHQLNRSADWWMDLADYDRSGTSQPGN